MNATECRKADHALLLFLGQENESFWWLENQPEKVQALYDRLRRSYSIMESLRRTADHCKSN